MNFCIISGSSREKSNTFRVAKALENIIKKEHNVFFVDFVGCDFPMIGRKNIDKNNLSNFQSFMIDSFKKAHLIIICIPEYNWNTNPEIINAFHQIGTQEYKECFENKVFSFVGVSTGFGGRKPAIEMIILLNKIISFMKAIAIVSPLILESHHTDVNIDPYGYFINLETEKHFKNFIEYTLQIAQKWHKES